MATLQIPKCLQRTFNALLGLALAAVCAVLPAEGHTRDGGHEGQQRAERRDDDKARRFAATIRRTSYGVPNILAKDHRGLGYGQGYAYAQDRICDMVERWVIVRGERAKYFGQTTANLASDAFWQGIRQAGHVERLLKARGPQAPLPEVREMVEGYVKGYNRYLSEVGVANIPDPRCRGQEYISPISEDDIWLNTLHWAMAAGSVTQTANLFRAAPPTVSARRSVQDDAFAAMALDDVVAITLASVDLRGLDDTGERPMSNMTALGAAATQNKTGIMFGNPHWQWRGPESFWEAHLTIPGKLNVVGFTVGGWVGLAIGANESVAWSHTVSTPAKFNIFRLDLVPGQPTRYLIDGEPHDMTSRTLTIPVRNADGSEGTVSHTFWDTKLGTVLATTTLPWTTTHAFVLGEPNVQVRFINQDYLYSVATSVQDLAKKGASVMGMPWFNTVAADKEHAYFGVLMPVVHITEDKRNACGLSGFGNSLVLDGSRSECHWGTDKDSPIPGIFGASSVPQLLRDDYVTQSNDSHWTTNPRQLLEGFPTVFGAERTQRSLRTRNGLAKYEHRLAGTDGRPGNKFTLESLLEITILNNVYVAEMWRDPLVAMCQGMSAEVQEACPILAIWNLNEDLDSPGALLFRRYVERSGTGAARFSVPFDPADPMNTPRGFVQDQVAMDALVNAVRDLRDSGIPLNATLRPYQYFVKGEGAPAIPVHGGPPGSGQYNFITSGGGWQPGIGYPNVNFGSSWIFWVEYSKSGPRGYSILTYSNSTDPTSPHFTDQTELWSRKGVKRMLWAESDIRRDPQLKITHLCSDRRGRECHGDDGDRDDDDD